MQRTEQRGRRATCPVSPARRPGLYRIRQTNGAELWLAMDEQLNIIDSEKVALFEHAGPTVERLGKLVYGDDVEAWDRAPLVLIGACDAPPVDLSSLPDPLSARPSRSLSLHSG